MSAVFEHRSVLLHETLAGLAPRDGGLYLDCTLGGAGHASALLAATDAATKLIGIDQDDMALDAARRVLMPFAERAVLRKANFAQLDRVLAEICGRSEGLLDGILFDLGVSSPQLDTEERGFSYWGDSYLDMRMDPSRPETAADILATRPEAELARILREYGEERWASRIASFVVKAREREPIRTSDQLVELIKQAIPASARREGGHPARRSFQALRIAVNDELGVLDVALTKAIAALKPGGRLAVITFHSLEDRLVKRCFQQNENPCQCPPGYPCVCGLKPTLRRVQRKPIVASQEELAGNPRARSAKLRLAERL